MTQNGTYGYPGTTGSGYRLDPEIQTRNGLHNSGTSCHGFVSMALKGKLNKPVEITGMADGMRAGSIPDQTLERITKCITAISGTYQKQVADRLGGEREGK